LNSGLIKWIYSFVKQKAAANTDFGDRSQVKGSTFKVKDPELFNP
jgi:hypothetical protein